MDIKLINEKLEQALGDSENNVKYQAFVDDYAMLLDEAKICVDTVNVAIKAVDLDHGVNFVDAFVALRDKDVQDAWKTIRGCDAFKDNAENKALKLACSFAASALGGDGNTKSILGNILTAVAFFIKSIKQKEETVVRSILQEYILEMLMKDAKLPKWNGIKMTPESTLIFCKAMKEAINTPEIRENPDKCPAYLEVKRWISQGEALAEESIEIKEREKSKTPKQSGELIKLAELIKQIEDERDKSIAEGVHLALENRSLQEKTYAYEEEISVSKKRVKELEAEMSELEKKIKEANQEVEERKKLNEGQVQYREDAQAALLQDIARSLKAEYGDFAETRDVPMNEMLGNIYRNKLEQIFKILEQKGIKVKG